MATATRKRKPFFQSQKHPHCEMNRWGVVLVPEGHPDGADYWVGFGWTPLRSGLLDMQREVEEEARAAGYRMDYSKREPCYVKPGGTR